MYIRLYKDSERVMAYSKNHKLNGMFEVEENIPKPEEKEGKSAVLYWNETDGFYYKYVESSSDDEV